MKNGRKVKLLFQIIIGCFLLSSASIILTPFSDFTGTSAQQAAAYICGILFWLGILAGGGIYIILLKQLKEIDSEGMSQIKGIGILRFLTSMPAAVGDCLLALSTGLVILSFFVNIFNQYIIIFFIFLFLFSFHLHYLLNGKIYRYMKGNELSSKNGQKVVRGEKI